MRLELRNWGGEIEGIIEWDPDTGALSGDLADKVRAIADESVRLGSVVSHPYPTVYDIVDPLHREPEMAVILGKHWQLPEPLIPHHPVIEDDAPEGDDVVY